MKNILFLTILIFISIGFISCGSDESSIGVSGEIIINIDTYCVEDETLEAINTYHNIQYGDTIVKDENSTVIEIYHKSDNTKSVCLVNGSAHIVRIL